MYKIKCPVCGSSHTMKNGKRKGVQLYVCGECRYQFRNRNEVSAEELWRCYLDGKQTVSELSAAYGLSPSTIKRRLSEVAMEWEQPSLDGGGFVHLDATYWGRGFGVLLALESSTGCPLYMSFVKNETTKDYEDAVCSIRARGYGIRGIIIDGRKSLFNSFAEYPIQMCQFHMKQIIRRYMTQENRKRFISGFFLALTEALSMNKQDPP